MNLNFAGTSESPDVQTSTLWDRSLLRSAEWFGDLKTFYFGYGLCMRFLPFTNAALAPAHTSIYSAAADLINV
jgi:hypothetical protein